MRCKNCGWENDEGAQVCVKCNSPLTGSVGPANHDVEPQQKAASINLHSTVREGMSLDWMKSSENDFQQYEQSPKPSEGQTIREIGFQKCPKCGYPIGLGMTTCPMCGTYLNDSAPKSKDIHKYADVVINKDLKGKNRRPNCSSCGNHVPLDAAFCPHCGASIKNNPIRGTVNPWSKPQDSAFFTLKPIAWEGEGVDYTPTTHSGDRIVLNRTNTDPNNNSITSKEQAVVTLEDGHWYIENKSDQKTTMIRIDRKIEIEDGDVIVLGNRMFEFKTM